jgi:adenylate kinase
MNLIFIGPQGSGKGTQAKIISEKLNLCHISTGDLLRNVNGVLKEKIDSYINKGNLVPDELMIKILQSKFNSDECKNGYILDGFPRNIKQAEYLDSIAEIDRVIEISISDSESVKRIVNRQNCKNCGNVYNLITNPPKKKGRCDKCGNKLYSRVDDTEEALGKRLKGYHRNTELILNHYDSAKVNGEQSIEKVTKDILMELSKIA